MMIQKIPNVSTMSGKVRIFRSRPIVPYTNPMITAARSAVTNPRTTNPGTNRATNNMHSALKTQCAMSRAIHVPQGSIGKTLRRFAAASKAQPSAVAYELNEFRFWQIASRLYAADVNRFGRRVVAARHFDPRPCELFGPLLIVKLVDGLALGVVEHIFTAQLDAGDCANLRRLSLLQHHFVSGHFHAVAIGDLAPERLRLLDAKSCA